MSDFVTFKERRIKLMNILGDGVLVMASARHQVRNHDVDFPFRQDSDFFYLTGFNEPDSVLILKKNASSVRSILLVPPKDKVKEIWEGKRAGVQGAIEHFGFDEAHSNEKLEEVLEEELEDENVLFYEFNRDLSLDDTILSSLDSFTKRGRTNPLFPQTIRFYGRDLGEMRHIKKPEEILLMRKAVEITREANHKVMQELKPGMNEGEVQALLEYEYRRNGGESGYGNIVACGENATILHYTNNDCQMNSDELLLIDSGCEYKFYTADVTRCYPVGGKFTPNQKKVYEIVLEANKKAIEKAVVGSDLKQVHKAALEVLAAGLVELGVAKGSLQEQIESGELGKYYMHNTSHWLGMDVHDVGLYDIAGEPVSFEPGMAFTIEPGLYFNPDFSGETTPFDGIGVRIEDNIVIDVDGPIVLTKDIPKEVDEIEKIMAER